MPSCLPPPQLSPCSSPTMDWWTSSRPSSPPPPPLPRQPVLLPCSAIAIYSCPPLSPRNTFTPHRYPLTLSFAFITKTKQQMSWRAGIHVFCLLVSEIVLQKLFTLDYTFPTRFCGASTVNNSYLQCDVWSQSCFSFGSLLVLTPTHSLLFKVQKRISWNLEAALQRLLVQKRNTDNILLGNKWIPF